MTQQPNEEGQNKPDKLWVRAKHPSTKAATPASTLTSARCRLSTTFTTN